MLLNPSKQQSQPHQTEKNDVSKLIETHQWRKVQMRVFLHKKEMSNNQNALRLACYHDAPVQVMKCLYNANPHAISVKDFKGNYPLHLACTQGCSPSVVKYFLKKYPQAAMETNIHDRSPFLLACKSYLWHHRYSQQKWHVANKDLLDVLQILSMAVPRSILTKEDCSAMTPLDYVSETKAMPIVFEYVDYLIDSEIHESKYSYHNCQAKAA